MITTDVSCISYIQRAYTTHEDGPYARAVSPWHDYRPPGNLNMESYKATGNQLISNNIELNIDGFMDAKFQEACK